MRTPHPPFFFAISFQRSGALIAFFDEGERRGRGECISRRKNSAQSLGKPFPFPRLKDFFIQLIHARASPACTTCPPAAAPLNFQDEFELDKMWSVALSSKAAMTRTRNFLPLPQQFLIISISFPFRPPFSRARIFQISTFEYSINIIIISRTLEYFDWIFREIWRWSLI